MIEINLEGYDKVRSSGIGGNASVYKLCNKEGGYVRALRETSLAEGEEESFMEHCRLLLRLGNGCHPYITRVYGCDIKDGKGRVLMDYVHGCCLTDYFKDNQEVLPADEVMRLFNEVGSALAYCHHDIYLSCYDKIADDLKDDPNDGRKAFIDEKARKELVAKYRVIHNDVHSGNIMRRDDGGYVLLDFDRAVGLEIKSDVGQFNAGAPEFVAPEKLKNDPGFVPTPQVDVYGFGVIIYQALTGRPPFILPKNMQLDSALAMLRKEQQESMPLPISVLRKNAFEQMHPGESYKQDYPEWLEGIVMKCLAKDPNDRYADCKEMYDEFLMLLHRDRDGAAVMPLPLVGPQRDSGVTEITELSDTQPGGEEDMEQTRMQLVEMQQRLDDSSSRIESLTEENDALKKGKKKRGGILWIILAVLFFLTTVAAVALYLFGKTPGSSGSATSSDGNKVNEQPATVDSLAFQHERDSLQSVIDGLRANAPADTRNLVDQLVQKDKEIAGLKKVNEELQAAVGSGDNGEAMESLKANMEQEISAKNDEIRTLEAKVEDLKRQFDNAGGSNKDQNKQYEATIKMYKKMLDEKSAAVKKKDAEIEKLKKQNKSLEDKVGGLEQEQKSTPKSQTGKSKMKFVPVSSTNGKSTTSKTQKTLRIGSK